MITKTDLKKAQDRQDKAEKAATKAKAASKEAQLEAVRATSEFKYMLKRAEEEKEDSFRFEAENLMAKRSKNMSNSELLNEQMPINLSEGAQKYWIPQLFVPEVNPRITKDERIVPIEDSDGSIHGLPMEMPGEERLWFRCNKSGHAVMAIGPRRIACIIEADENGHNIRINGRAVTECREFERYAVQHSLARRFYLPSGYYIYAV